MSVSYAAVALAKKIFGDLKGRSVLVVGAGEMGKLTALHMKSQGVQHVTIISRTMAHAARTAEAIGGSAAPWDELDTGARRERHRDHGDRRGAPILTKARIEAVMRPRRNRPLFIIDIAMPRDVEAAAGEIEQVFLYNIDDLQATVRENLARRASEVARAERSSPKRSRSSAAGSARAARSRPSSRSGSGSRRSGARSWSGWSSSCRRCRPSARARVDEITHLIVEKLLLTPTEQLKSLGDAETVGAYAEALTRLFGLAQQAEREPEPPGRPRRAFPAPQQPRAAAVSRPEALRLGTRGSQLALWQAHEVASRIAAAGGRPAALSSSRRRAIGCRTRPCRKSAASGSS